MGAQRVRQLFEQAKTAARKQSKSKAIIFIDEIDVLGGQRGKHSSHLEYDQTLNQLLVEMDGISNTSDIQILVIGATNRPDLLDGALLRPGRFDHLVKVDLPEKEARLQILQVHTRNKPLAPDIDLAPVSYTHLDVYKRQEVLNAPAMIYERSRTADLSLNPVADSNGKLHPMAFGKYETAADITLRRNAYAETARGMKAYQNTYGATWGTEVKKNVAMAKLRGFDSAIHMLLDRQEVTCLLYTSRCV